MLRPLIQMGARISIDNHRNDFVGVCVKFIYNKINIKWCKIVCAGTQMLDSLVLVVHDGCDVWMDPACMPLNAFIVNLPLCACRLYSNTNSCIVFSHLRFGGVSLWLHWYRILDEFVCFAWLAIKQTLDVLFSRWVSQSIWSIWTKCVDWIEMCIFAA